MKHQSTHFVLFAALMTLNFFSPLLWRGAGGEALSQDTWTKVVGDGFGTTNNASISELYEFNGQLYAGTGRKTGSLPAELWRSSTGDSGSWTKITSFSPPMNTAMTFFSFNSTTLPGNYFWFAVSGTNGGMIYRSTDGANWTKINKKGFGNSLNFGISPNMVVFQGSGDTIAHLYAGTLSYSSSAISQIWRTPYDNADSTKWTKIMDFATVDTTVTFITYFYVWNNKIYFGTNAKGQLWESSDGINFTKNTGVGNGFGDNASIALTSMIDFNNQFYITTRHAVNGGEVWRTSDGSSWEQITDNAFGKDDTLDELHNIKASFGNVWITGLPDTAGAGATPIWRSEDGMNFTQSNTDGFGDADNQGEVPVTLSFGNYQYCSSRNDVTGAQLWRTPNPCSLLTASFTSDTGNYLCSGTTVNFTNTSTGALSYEWKENGTTFSTSTNASRTFNSTGTYTIRLVAINGTCKDSTEQSFYINATFTWQGDVSTNWNTAGNWDSGIVPGECNPVMIPGTGIAPTQPTISTAGMKCKNITISESSGGKVTISGSGTLTVTD